MLPGCRTRQDHPRICGEKCAVVVDEFIHVGITPAYAGKRASRRPQSKTQRDHPRICGEKVTRSASTKRRLGSPPHMRGKAIQAYAAVPVSWDHPRICGEKGLFCRPPAHVIGSPPHMRGKGEGLRDDLQRVGITPAYAGKSFRVSVRPCSREDHPRICGEKRKRLPVACPKLGSPPHMRGKGRPPASASVSAGITPAYAGKSRC